MDHTQPQAEFCQVQWISFVLRPWKEGRGKWVTAKRWLSDEDYRDWPAPGLESGGWPPALLPPACGYHQAS